jgi:hypothetical protein
MLPIKKNPNAIDQSFVQYLLAMTDGVTGRIIDVLRRAALDAVAHQNETGWNRSIAYGRCDASSNRQSTPLNPITDIIG